MKKTDKFNFAGVLKWTLWENIGMTLLSVLSALTLTFFLIQDFSPRNPAIEAKENVTSEFLELYAISIFVLAFIIGFIQILINYSFLYSRRKLDFLHAAPVKREMIFAAKSISQIINAAIFMFITYALILLYVLTSDEMYFDYQTVFMAILMQFVSFLLFAATVSFFAVSEGRLINALFSSVFALFIVPAGAIFFILYLTQVFKIIMFPVETIAMFFPIFSFKSPLAYEPKEFALLIAIRLILALLMYGAAMYAYKKRKTETATQIKPSLASSVMIVSCAALLSFFGLYALTMEALTYPIVFYSVSFVSGLIFTMIYFFAVLKKRKAKQVFAVLGSFVLFFASAYGLTTALKTYSSKVISYTPDISEVETVSVKDFTTAPTGFSATLYTLVTNQSYAKEAVELREEDTIKTVIDLNKETIAECEKGTPLYDRILVTYKLKNGKTVSRLLFKNKVTFPDGTTGYTGELDKYTELLSHTEYILNSQKQKIGKEVLGLAAAAQDGSVVQSSDYQIMDKKDAEEFLACYEKDLREIGETGLFSKSKDYPYTYEIKIFFANKRTPTDFDITDINNESLGAYGSEGENTLFSYTTIKINAFHAHCLKFLESNGMEFDMLDISEKSGEDLFLQYGNIVIDENGNVAAREEGSTPFVTLEELLKTKNFDFPRMQNAFGQLPVSYTIDDTQKIERLRQAALKQTAEEKEKILKENQYVTVFYFIENTDYSSNNDTDSSQGGFVETQASCQKESVCFVLPTQEFEKI